MEEQGSLEAVREFPKGRPPTCTSLSTIHRDPLSTDPYQKALDQGLFTLASSRLHVHPDQQ